MINGFFCCIFNIHRKKGMKTDKEKTKQDKQIWQLDFKISLTMVCACKKNTRGHQRQLTRLQYIKGRFTCWQNLVSCKIISFTINTSSSPLKNVAVVTAIFL